MRRPELRISKLGKSVLKNAGVPFKRVCRENASQMANLCFRRNQFLEALPYYHKAPYLSWTKRG